MEIAKNVLLVFHIVAIAGLFGGWFMQLKAIGRGEANIPAGMVHSGWLALVTGLAMFGIVEAMSHPGMSIHIKIGVKLVLLVVVMVLLMMNRKKERVAPAVMWTVGVLTLANICIAVLWQ